MSRRWSRFLLLGVLLCAAAVACGAALLRAPLACAAGLLAAGAVAAGAARLGAAWERLPTVLLVVFALAVLGWALAVDSQQVSDFGVYFRCGGEFVPHGWDFKSWASRCESQWLPGFASYWRRSLLYTLPVGLLSGGDYTALKLADAIYHVAAVAVAYRLAAGAFGRRAGLLAAALLAIYPEFWFATTVATTDNLVPLGLLLFMGGLAGVEKEPPSAGRFVAVLALVAALDLLRSLGPILVLALAAFTVAAEAGRARRIGLLLTGASAAVVVLLGATPSWLGVSGAQYSGVLGLLAGNGLSHPRTFAEIYTWNQYVLPVVPPGDRHAMTVGLLAQDLQGAIWMPWNWIQKLAQLFTAEGYYYFSAAGPLGSPDDYIVPGRTPAVVFRPALAAFFAGTVAFTCVAGAIGALRGVTHPVVRAAAATSAAIILYIALVGETQARYSIMVAPGLCIAAAGLLCPSVGPARAAAFDALRSFAAAAVAALCLVIAGKAWAAQQLADSGSLAWQAGPTAGAACATGVAVEPHWVGLKDGACLALSATPDHVTGQIGFYVVRTPIPPRWDHRPLEPVAFTIVARRADGSRTETQRVLGPTEVVTHVSVPTDRLAELSILVVPTKAPQAQVAFTYFHDQKNVITNRLR